MAFPSKVHRLRQLNKLTWHAGENQTSHIFCPVPNAGPKIRVMLKNGKAYWQVPGDVTPNSLSINVTKALRSEQIHQQRIFEKWLGWNILHPGIGWRAPTPSRPSITPRAPSAPHVSLNKVPTILIVIIDNVVHASMQRKSTAHSMQ